ncbi:MAG: CHAT domain-containing protein [Candidatus Thorarchaeota archaeon]
MDEDEKESEITQLLKALKDVSQEDSPEDWAIIQHNLGVAFTNRTEGIQDENLEQAVHHCKQALRVFSRHEYPYEWATTQNSIGNAFKDCNKGERRENLERAIHYYENALAVFNHEDHLKQWAGAQYNLGATYGERIEGEDAANLEQAIRCYKLALDVLTPQNYPILMASVQNNIGYAFIRRIMGNRAENIELAIHHLLLSLEVYSKDAFPIGYANGQINLGYAYAERIHGDRAENLEQAIYHNHEALKVYSTEFYPVRWATTQSNLGTVFDVRIVGNKAENLEQAIHHYNQSLLIRTFENTPFDWSDTQHNLAGAYSSRIEGDQDENLEYAIYHYEQALQVRTFQKFPFSWAMTMHGLGMVYTDRKLGERLENLERAIHFYCESLEVFTIETYPFEWATIHNSLGLAYKERIKGDEEENIRQAILHFEQALRVRNLDALPAYYLQTNQNIGNLYFTRNSWKRALGFYSKAIKANDILLASAYTDTGRRHEVSESSHLYTNAAYTLLQLGKLNEALTMLENGKTRLFSEAVSIRNVDLSILPLALSDSVRAFRKKLHDLKTEMLSQQNTPFRRDNKELISLITETQFQLNELVENIRKDYPDFLKQGLKLKQILSLIPENGALVAPFATSKGGAALVVPYAVKKVMPKHIVWLGAQSNERVFELLHGVSDTKKNEGWVSSYSNFTESRTREALDQWQKCIKESACEIWNSFMEPIHKKLVKLRIEKDSPIVFMSQGGMGLLPLHAATKSSDIKGRTVLDHYIVSYGLSAQVVKASQEYTRRQSSQKTSLLAIVNPSSNLRYASAEGEYISAKFPLEVQKKLEYNDATRESVLENAGNFTHLHFACHGSYDWDNVMQSGLWLARSESSSNCLLSLEEIVSSLALDHTRLVTLSACETGIFEVWHSPDEFIGLPTGFIEAGAACVISSLWAVDDLSTTLLMEHFYEEYTASGSEPSPAQSLRAAQLWLRDEVTYDYVISHIKKRFAYLVEQLENINEFSDKASLICDELLALETDLVRFKKEMLVQPNRLPFSEPFYWAAFIVTGL